MNQQISLQKEAYWTLRLNVVDSSHHSNPRSSSKDFPLEGVLHIK